MATLILPIKVHDLYERYDAWNKFEHKPTFSVIVFVSLFFLFTILVNGMKIHLLSPQQRLEPVCTTRLVIFNLNYEIKLEIIW